MGVKVRERPGKGWYVFTDWKNKRKAKFFGKNKGLAKSFADKLAAKLKWAEQSGEAVALNRPNTSMPTITDYLTEWLRVYVDAHCKVSTASEYRKVILKHLLPALGERPLHEVTRADIKRLIATLVVSGRKKQTIHNILTPLKEAYNHAIDDGLVTVNPVLRTGRLVSRQDSSNSHIDPLTAEEIRLLLKTTQDCLPVFYPVFLCAVRTGMREGELLGLQWGDIDFRGRFIEVRRAVVRRQMTTPKSHKIRRVDMSPQLAGVLAALKETRELEYALKGQQMPEWVFLGPAGQPMNASTLRKALYRSLEAAGLRHVRFHDLRHTFASLLIQQGANAKYIQEQLGHGTISVTLNIYCHLFPGAHRHHVKALDDPQDPGLETSPTAGKSATLTQPVVVNQTEMV